MMKLFKEEKAALKTGLNKAGFFLFILFLSVSAFPQIPFKGYCKLTSFDCEKDYSKILSFNYDRNEYSDILIFTSQKKQAKLFTGLSGTEFSKSKDVSFPLEISELKPINNTAGQILAYSFSSRKNMEVGTLKFNSSGSPVIINRIKLDSYPQNISISDLGRKEGSRVYLISGNSFDGLSLISEVKTKLSETKIVSKSTYKYAEFIDLNSDGFVDIAALSSADNQLHFYLNNSRDQFSLIRKIDFNDDVLFMQVFDFNYDGFKDVIVSTANNIQILYGDASTAYSKKIIIPTLFSADKFIYGDFNRDGYFDINYINISDGIIATIFAKDFENFHSEFIQRKQTGITDIIPFFSKFIYGAAILDQKGKINILSTVAALSEDQDIAAGVEPGKLLEFDNNNDGISDFAFIDDYDNRLKFVLRSSSGLPVTFFDVKIFEKHSELICFNKSKDVKTFLLYSKNKRVVELIEINFSNYSFKRTFQYSDGPIQDVFGLNGDKKEFTLALLYEKSKTLILNKINQSADGFITETTSKISSSWSNPFLFFSDKVSVGFFEYNPDSLLLKTINNPEASPIYKTEFYTKPRNFVVLLKTQKTELSGYNNFTALIAGSENTYLINGDGKKSTYYSSTATKDDLRITEENQLFFGKNNSVFIYNRQSKSLTEVLQDNQTKQLFIRKSLDDIELKDCIIHSFDKRKQSLIYSNSLNNCISIKQIK